MMTQWRMLIVALVALSVVGCTKDPQETARERLVGELGVVWAPGNFLEAAKNGNNVIVGLFLDAGIDSETEDAEGNTAVILATQAGHAGTVAVLLVKGADANNTNNDGKTALILACEENQTGPMLALLEKGADVNVKAPDGTTALSAAEKRGDTETVQLLKTHGAK
jgi:ankyrin repeat protein